MKPFLDSSGIDKIVNRISAEINNTFPENEQLIVLGIGNDSLYFANTLMSKITLPITFDTVYVDVVDYPKGTDNPITTFHKLPQVELHDKNIVLIDIFSGDISKLNIVKCKLFKLFEPRSVTYCSLLKEKRSSEYIHYLGGLTPNGSVPYGFGIALNGLNSNLPEVFLDKK